MKDKILYDIKDLAYNINGWRCLSCTDIKYSEQLDGLEHDINCKYYRDKSNGKQ